MFDKILSLLLCFCFVTISLLGLQFLSGTYLLEGVEGVGDTGSSPIKGLTIGTVIEQAEADLRDIAWNPEGTIAVAVGVNKTGGGVAYRYDIWTGNWVNITHNEGNPLYGVTWHDGNGRFIVVGNGTGGKRSVFQISGIQWENPSTSPFQFGQPNRIYFDVVSDSENNLLFVGSGQFPVKRLSGENWHEIQADNQFDYHSVTFHDEYFHFVGSNGTSGRFYSLHYSGSNPNPINPPHYYRDTGQPNWAWNRPLYGVEARGSDVLVVGDNIVDVYNNGYYQGSPARGLNGTQTFYGATWISDTPSAYLVGRGSGKGIIYHYRQDINRVSVVPSSQFVVGTQYAVAESMVAPHIFISVGDHGSDSAWQIFQTSGFDDIITDVHLPRIESVEMFEVGDLFNTPLFNRQINVNGAGFQHREYEIQVLVSHGLPGTLDMVELSAWFDHGAVGDYSGYPGEQDPNRTTAFRVRWDRNAPVGDEFTWEWPTPHGDQMEIMPGDHWYQDLSGGDLDEFHLRFRFIPGPQMRFANGTDGHFNPNPNPYNKSQALNTPNTWDVMVEATDTNNGFNRSYDEFGVYRFTSLTISGLPGTYGASGAPGMNDVMLVNHGGSSYVNYSANCGHALKVYLETDLIGMDTGASISAVNISVQGGYHGKNNFSGPGESNAIYLLGNGIDHWNQPRMRFNYTTTKIDTLSESNSLYPIIDWWIDIPWGIPEDSYRTSLVYVLEHDG